GKVAPLPEGGALRVLPGPDAPEAQAALLEGTFRVSARSDRVGTRLEGRVLPRHGADGGVSMPMVRGAIQLPASGGPVWLGTDQPTTGRYPVVAVMIRADHGRIGALRPGDAASYVAASLLVARIARAAASVL